MLYALWRLSHGRVLTLTKTLEKIGGGGPLRNSKLLKLLALIFAFSLIAAACGDDDDDGGSSSSSDNSALSEESSDDDASSSETAEEEAKEEDHSDDDGHDHSDDEEAEEEAAGAFSDAVNGDGAELLESLIDNPPGAADDSLDPVVITMSNIEGTPVGSFPEIREGAAAAAKAFNENYGGMNGRPIDFQPCVHGLDPAEATNCANDIADEAPTLHIQGIDFFNPLQWPTLVAAGVPVMQTVPIFVSDFNTPGLISTEGGCVSAFPTGMQYMADVVKADPLIILYANSAPGIECYNDTEARPAQQLVDEGKLTSFVGVEDASGDPTDNEAVVQRIMEAAATGDNPGVFFGLQASDCAELVAGMVAAGYDGVIVSSASCKDDSVLSQPFSHGMVISGEEEIYTPNEGIELSAYQTKYNPWRDANQDAYGPDAPKSQFMNVAHDVMVTAIITMMRFENGGGDVDDNAALIEYLAGQDNWNRAGRSKPMDCTTNSSEFVSVCKKDAGYYIWNGYENGGWSYGPLGTEILDATDLLLRMAEGPNARPAAG